MSRVGTVAVAACAAALCACGLIDSPSRFSIATPVRLAANGGVVIFAAPTESDSCALNGGAVTLVAAVPASGAAPLRFAYRRGDERPREDVLTLETAAGRLELSATARYRFFAPGADAAWQTLKSLSSSGARRTGRAGATLLLQPRNAGYFIQATDARHRTFFSGIVLPRDGYVYARQAVFTRLIASYSVESQHNCGNWDTAGTATAALRRVEDSVPR